MKNFEIYFTFLTSKPMTITALYVIPFIVVFHTKCVHTIFFSEIIWLILGPSCKGSFSSIRPSKVTLHGYVIQAKPGFFSIETMLYVNVFFVVADINKNRVFLSTSGQCCCPICAGFTCKVTVTIEIAPPRITDICKNITFLL